MIKACYNSVVEDTTGKKAAVINTNHVVEVTMITATSEKVVVKAGPQDTTIM